MFSIPDKGKVLADAQSIVFQEYIDILADGISMADCVRSGCAVTTAGTSLTLNIAAGVVTSNNIDYTIATTVATLSAADAALARFDCVVINAAGVASVRTGVASNIPVPPALLANDVVLAIVYVPATNTAVASNQVVDLRVINGAQPKNTTLSLLAALTTTSDARSYMQASGAYSIRNKLINGNFTVNQLAVSGSVVLAAGAYGHDMFKAGAAGCTYTFATVNNITTLTISAGSLMQVIEGVNLQSGTHTLSWTGTAQARIDTGAYGASGITGTAVGGTNQTCEWGIGTVSLVQYERGSVATPFENRPEAIEFELCSFYYTEVVSTVIWNTTASVGQVTLACYPVNMRSTPTIAIKVAGAPSGCTETANIIGSGKIVSIRHVITATGTGGFSSGPTIISASARL